MCAGVLLQGHSRSSACDQQEQSTSLRIDEKLKEDRSLLPRLPLFDQGTDDYFSDSAVCYQAERNALQLLIRLQLHSLLPCEMQIQLTA